MADDSQTTNTSTANSSTGNTSTSGTTTNSSTTPAASSSTSSSSSSTTPSTGTASDTGYLFDEASKTLTVNQNTYFKFNLPVKLDDTTVVAGWVPEGILIDTTNSTVSGRCLNATGSAISIYTASTGFYTLTLKVNKALSVSYVASHPVYDEHGAFFSKSLIPAYRVQGQEPAIGVSGYHGSGNYTYSLTGETYGLTIDSATGTITGKLPTSNGFIVINVTVDDGIEAKQIELPFFVSDRIPVDKPIDYGSFDWWDSIETNFSVLKDRITALSAGVTSSTMWSDAYIELMRPMREFVANPAVEAVKLVSAYATELQTYLGTADDRLKANYTTEDQMFLGSMIDLFKDPDTTSASSLYLVKTLGGSLYAVRTAIDAAK